VGAVRLRLRHELGTDAAGDAEQAGRALSPGTAVALARDVLALPAPRRAVLDDGDAGDGGLTPREAEVAALVRNGCTNRQIGRRLGISEKTAEVHVHHVMRKLGAGNRAEVAAWVAARDRSAPEPAP
jgi:non-specific serine/threonine protein kinase